MTELRDRKWDHDDEPSKLWTRLTDAWRDLRTALRSIPRLVVRPVTFTGPATSLSFAWSGKRPVGVLLVDLMRTDTGAAAGVTFSWSFESDIDGGGNIVTTSFAALASAPWRATFIVIGGE